MSGQGSIGGLYDQEGGLCLGLVGGVPDREEEGILIDFKKKENNVRREEKERKSIINVCDLSNIFMCSRFSLGVLNRCFYRHFNSSIVSKVRSTA